MRNYKKISEPPKEFERLIEKINLLPPQAEEVWENWDGTTSKLRPLIDARLFTYLMEEEANPVERWLDLIKTKNLLLKISEINKKFGAKEIAEKYKDPNFRFKVRLEFLTINFADREVSGLLSFDEKGSIKPYGEFLALILKYDIPFYRIRRCDVCGRIFWAKRADAGSCGDKNCSDILSQRKYQDKKRRRKAEVNEQRRENYRYKKNRKGGTT